MKTQSAKAKGRKFQQHVRDRILVHFPELTSMDVRSTSMGASGADILFSKKAADALPLYIECKNQEKLNIWEALAQAEAGADGSPYKPVVAFKRNKSKSYICVELDSFLEMVKQQ